MSALERPKTLVRTELKPLARLVAEARAKIAEDILRFRTCGADPRASK
jgi:hypothetical protein